MDQPTQPIGFKHGISSLRAALSITISTTLSLWSIQLERSFLTGKHQVEEVQRCADN
jgi:hypothetical protein